MLAERICTGRLLAKRILRMQSTAGWKKEAHIAVRRLAKAISDSGVTSVLAHEISLRAFRANYCIQRNAYGIRPCESVWEKQQVPMEPLLSQDMIPREMWSARSPTGTESFFIL